jgi:hypothetical protein
MRRSRETGECGSVRGPKARLVHEGFTDALVRLQHEMFNLGGYLLAGESSPLGRD